MTNPSPESRLAEAARALGFDWFAIAEAKPRPGDLAELERWLAEGRHGNMEWLARDPARRTDPELVLPGCRSVVVLGMNYLREEVDPRRTDHLPTPGYGRISRYARTRDYHRVIENALRKLARLIDQELVPGARSRPYVDYGPVMERPWAAEAGLGFIGKNTMLIHPQEGSFHFLAVLLTTAELAPGPGRREVRGCGDCRRCIDACPTGAITEPWRLDSRRCISYLTIEKKGALTDEESAMLNGWLVGCDICQDVCPYNGARARPVGESALGEPFVPAELRLVDLIQDAEGYLESLPASSPLRRVGAENLRRNALAELERGKMSAAE
ncbi:tRNA epoxyqueuosine(34) reductase QueG [bacterium]|nr:tRNA epoxyqueuosine(34) reductase QueG [bacterium]